MSLFHDLLAEKEVLLADGATGTNLFAMGLQSGDAPEAWNQDHPERIEALHKGFVEAGSDLFLTNSFGGSRYRLKLHGLENDVKGVNNRAAQIGRKVADGAGRPVLVAGSVGPTGELLEPLGAMTFEDCKLAFAEQIEGLAEGGVDLVYIETISAPEELRAAVEAAVGFGLPICATMSFDSAGRTMMGLSPAAFSTIAAENRLDAFGANCGVGASDLMSSVLSFRRAQAENPEHNRPVIAKANCGIPRYVDDKIVYSGTEELMADYALLARASGVKIIGGCCGATSAHIAAMRKALDDPNQSRDLAVLAINKALGQMSEGAQAIAEGGKGKKGEGRQTKRRR